MVVISLARRPLGAGSVASNVLQHGCGALNIDACRIKTGDDLNGGAYAAEATDRHDGAENWRFKRGDIGGLEGKSFVQPTGRWPANLILSHLPGCERVGTKRVKVLGATPHRAEHKTSSDSSVGTQSHEHLGFRDADGTETVSAWSCVDGCPCLDLDRQSGVSTSSGGRIGNKDGGGIYGGGQGLAGAFEAGDPGFGDVGGASRYFKQVGAGGRMSASDLDDVLDVVGGDEPSAAGGVPKDLLDYLYTMITPTHVGGESLIALDLQAVDWASIPDGKYHGVIARGEPDAEQVEHLWRVVKPGAHVLLIAPDSCPTGHRGACSLEDKGFEIRDAILWVREAGRLHYVPKANTRERNAGCEGLAIKRKGEPTYVLTAKAAADEEVLEEVSNTLSEAGVPDEVIDTITDVGILKSKIPESVIHYFKKKEGSGKYGNLHPCLAPDALVMTSQGYRPVSEVQVGDQVYSADGEFHRVTHVSHHLYTSPNLYEIAVRGTNYTTLASDNHPFLIWRPTRSKKGDVAGGAVQWLQADEVRKGDYTMTPVRPGPGDCLLVEGDKNFWFLFGLYLAEGVLQKAGHGASVYPSFSLHEDETHLIDRIKAQFESVGVYPKKGSRGVQVMAFDAKAGETFFKMGGKGSSTKALHSDVWHLAPELQRAILDGYLAGDGGRVRTYMQAKTVSPDLASQLQILGEAAGYHVNLFRYEPTFGKGIGKREFKSVRPVYQVQFYERNREDRTTRRASRPMTVEHEGTTYTLRYVKSVTGVPYEGDVWNLSVEGSPTFQTAVGMSHNTVKPKDVLARLLADVPEGATVLDPFMGSGSMALACLETGHDYVGIEKEPEYLEIADARVHHWDHAKSGWIPTTIESDLKPVDGEKKVIAAESADGDALDLFGE